MINFKGENCEKECRFYHLNECDLNMQCSLFEDEDLDIDIKDKIIRCHQCIKEYGK